MALHHLIWPIFYLPLHFYGPVRTQAPGTQAPGPRTQAPGPRPPAEPVKKVFWCADFLLWTSLPSTGHQTATLGWCFQSWRLTCFLIALVCFCMYVPIALLLIITVVFFTLAILYCFELLYKHFDGKCFINKCIIIIRINSKITNK